MGHYLNVQCEARVKGNKSAYAILNSWSFLDRTKGLVCVTFRSQLLELHDQVVDTLPHIDEV